MIPKTIQIHLEPLRPPAAIWRHPITLGNDSSSAAVAILVVHRHCPTVLSARSCLSPSSAVVRCLPQSSSAVVFVVRRRPRHSLPPSSVFAAVIVVHHPRHRPPPPSSSSADILVIHSHRLCHLLPSGDHLSRLEASPRKAADDKADVGGRRGRQAYRSRGFFSMTTTS